MLIIPQFQIKKNSVLTSAWIMDVLYLLFVTSSLTNFQNPRQVIRCRTDISQLSLNPSVGLFRTLADFNDAVQRAFLKVVPGFQFPPSS